MQGHTKQNQPNQPISYINTPADKTSELQNNSSFSVRKPIIVLRHGLRKVFRPLFITKIVSSLARPGKALPLPWRSSTSASRYISNNRRIRLIGSIAVFTLVLLSVATVAPLTKKTEYTEAATGTASDTILTIATTDYPTLDLSVNNIGGTFTETAAGSGQGSFTVTTNNYTGYTLSISASDNTGTLINPDDENTTTNSISSIASAMSSSTFNSTTNNGKWGYKPSMLNSSANTNYLPAPTTTATTLNVTNCANGKSNGVYNCPNATDTYTIDLAARLQYTQGSGDYSKTFILTAVGNQIDYTVSYTDESSDGTDIPADVDSQTDALYITLSSTTPTREGYTFAGWCTVSTGTDGTDACTGTVYQPGDQYPINQTTENIADLHAMWEPDSVSLYSTVAAMSKGKQTAAQLQAAITVPTSADRTQDTSNSGVYEYDASVFGAATDAADTHKIYYYRGVLENSTASYGSDGSAVTYPNYVRLGGNSTSSTCWRIVRTTGSGGVKMIYNGTWTGSTCANATDNAQNSTSVFNTNAASNGKSIVGVGYTYNSGKATTTSSTSISDLFGTDSSNSNTSDSNIKTAVQNFYTSNLTSYASKLEPSAGYCADRTVYNNNSYAIGNKLAESTNLSTPYTTSSSGITVYRFGAFARNMSTSQNPTLGCPRNIVDLYTANSATNGNKQLGNYPIALLTADEASFAGSGSSTASNGSSYHANSFLRSGSNFWLLSPSIRYSNGYARVFSLFSDGFLYNYYVGYAYGVRPAISLNSSVGITSGSGTATDPWEVQ